ncbi:MAG: hypothetical protein LBH28_00970 [Oscillospiraceae bacterium]|jgi:hypothetical protein|nr:hypothetical protein [Oscillospiraceae bacterium]
MKKCFIAFLLLLVLLLVICPVGALADLIFTPPDDFYEMHYSECVHLNRSFCANGREGFISVKTEPGSSEEVERIENGEVFNISFTYNNKGEQWGVITHYDTEEPFNQWRTGWIPMDSLLLVYDYISFDEDHQDEFYQYSGDYESLYDADDIVFWTWPGSGEIAMTFGESGQRNPDLERDWLVAEHAYKDSDGREWGFIPYFYAHKNTWVCLGSPSNHDIPAFNPPPKPELWQPGDTYIARGWLSTLLIMAAILVVGAAVLIRIFWRPNRNVQQSGFSEDASHRET